MRIVRKELVRHVPLSAGKAGWPKLAPDTPHTEYRLENGKVAAFVTDIGNGVLLGWDLCGVCAEHMNVCRCPAVTPPRAVVYCYRTRRKLTDIVTGKGYIGLVHDEKAKGGVRFDIESPINRRIREDASGAGKAADIAPKRRVIRRTVVVPDTVPAAVQRIVRSRNTAKPVRRIVRKSQGTK